jgi:hypothetical protein
MTEKVDVAGFLAYNTGLDDMDFRCSNPVAVLAVLIGSGACAFFAPAACAGDRIDFSAPAIPLSVPQPEVEAKKPVRTIGSSGVASGFMGGAEMAPSSQYYIVKPRKREMDTWGLEPLLGDDPDQRRADDWFNLRPDSTGATNSSRLNMKSGLNPNASGNTLQQRYDSGPDGGPNVSRFGLQDGLDRDNPRFATQIGLDNENSRFGAQNGLDRDNSRFGAKNGLDRDNAKFGAQNGSDRDKSKFGAKNELDPDKSKFEAQNGLDPDKPKLAAQNGLDRDYSKFDAQNGLDKDNAHSTDRFGRAFSSAGEDSFWTKDFSHDAAATDRFSPMRLVPSMSEAKPLSGGAYEERMSNPWQAQDSAQMAAPPSYPDSTRLDDRQSRPFDQQFGGGQVSLRAWDPGASSVLPPRSFSNPEQIYNSRVVSHFAPATLPMPQRPGDPH